MISYLRKNILIPLYDKRNKNDRLEYLSEVTNELTGSEEHIRRNQFLRLKKIISYAYENIPFYTQLYDKHAVNVRLINNEEDFKHIPMITKNEIRVFNDEILNPQFEKRELIKSGTGGTTQAPIPFYLDRESFSRRQAATLFFFRWFNYELGDKIAYLWGAEQDYSSSPSFKSKVLNFATYRMVFLPSSHLSEETMWSFYHKLQKFRPKVLQAYPTPLFILSCFLEKHDLRLRIPNIEVTAERLYDHQRNKIEDVFDRKIFNWYGARELGHCATQCNRHDGMHINSYGLYLEVLKDDKRVFDEYGDIVATDLFNKAMPIIRYRIDDIGVISKHRCSCGSPLPILKDVIGRHDDIFKKRDGTLVPGVSLGSFLDEITEDCGGIEQFQIIQKDYEEFELNIVKGQNFDIEELEYFKQGIREVMHEELRFSVNFVDEIPKESSGKIRCCISEIPDSF